MKFALTHKGEIAWGPTDFNAAFLNAVLEDLGFPPVDRYVDTRLVTVIDEDTQTYFLPVNEIFPEYNNLTSELVRSHHEIKYKITTNYPSHVNFYYSIIQRPLSQIKEDLKTKTKQYRDEYRDFTINYTIGEKIVNIRTDDKTRLSLVMKIASGDGPYKYKFGHDWINATKADLQDILSKIDEKIQFSFDWQNSKFEEIENASSITDLLKIDISSPPKTPEPVEENINEPEEEVILEKVYDSDGNLIGYQIQGYNLVQGS